MAYQTRSYAVQLTNVNRVISETIAYYRNAVAYIIPIADKHYDEWISIKHRNPKRDYLDKYLHSTANSNAVYDFDQRFYKLPSYLRREAVATAIGIVMSYRSNLKNWQDTDQTTKPPRLTTRHHVFPTLYLKNMFVLNADGTAKIKIRKNNDWVWHTVTLRQTDLKYLDKHKRGLRPSAPQLEKRHGKYYLRFSFQNDRLGSFRLLRLEHLPNS